MNIYQIQNVVKHEPYKPMTLEQTKENLVWRISTDEMIVVELKSNKKMIGNVYLGKRDFDSSEIGCVFNDSYWGKGYAKEAHFKQNIYFWKYDHLPDEYVGTFITLTGSDPEQLKGLKVK